MLLSISLKNLVMPKWAAFFVTVMLAACGGGGDGGSGGFVQPTTNFNAFAAWTNLLQPAALTSWTVSGTGSDGNVYESTMFVQVVPNAVFPLDAIPYFVTSFGSQLKANGTAISSKSIQNYFDAGWQTRGLRNSATVGTTTTTTCDAVVSGLVPPTAAKVNASGTLYDADIHASCTPGSVVVGRSIATWSVEFEAGFVFLCINTQDSDLGGNPQVTNEQNCVEIDEAGRLGTRARVSLGSNSPSFSLVARNY